MTEIKISGDFTMENALKWKEVLNSATNGNEDLRLNLLEVSEADIVGVNALISTHKLLANKDKQLRIILKKDSEIYELLHLTKFLPILNVSLV
jgi:anti-anti-sigma regulatory factor